MALSTPGNQQVRFANLKNVDWVYILDHTAILEQSVFRCSFSVIAQPAIDIVVFYEEETNDPYGFGFVANKESYETGGTFRTDLDTANRLKIALLSLADVLRHRHTSNQSQSHVGEPGQRKLVNYIQFRVPSLLLEHQFSNYFNKFTRCDYRVVALFDKNPCGFGFVEVPPSDVPKDSLVTNYYNQFKGTVEELKMIISGGLAGSSGSFLGQGAIGGRMTHSAQQQQQQRSGKGRGSAASEEAGIYGSFLGQGVIGSRMIHNVQQQQWGERGSGSAASEEIFNPALNTFGFQPTVGVTRYEAPNTPSSAHWWSVSQPGPSYVFDSAAVMGQSSSGSFSGGHPNPTQWPRSRNVGGHSYTVMQQPQSFLQSQPRAGVIPHTAINRPSSAHFWSGTSTGITGQIFSGRLAGQQETNEWSGSQYGGGYSNTVMQQQPEPSIHYQTTAWPIFDAATSTGITGQIFGSRLAGQQETNEWSGSRYGGGYSNTVMQQQPEPSIHYQTTAWPIFDAATSATSSGSFGATDQLFSGSIAGVQPTTGEWSRAVGANRPVQNRDARSHPPPNPTAGNSAVYHPQWDMWK